MALIKLTGFAALLLLCLGAQAQMPDPLREIRNCGEPKRNTTGAITRRADVLAAFQRAHPCPSTGLPIGSCPRWNKDHVLPLANGGCDAVWNLQWLPLEIKSAAGAFPKDRWERKINASPAQVVTLP